MNALSDGLLPTALCVKWDTPVRTAMYWTVPDSAIVTVMVLVWPAASHPCVTATQASVEKTARSRAAGVRLLALVTAHAI